jgi:1-aminocyclopropane-1-carboxylate deaminase
LYLFSKMHLFQNPKVVNQKLPKVGGFQITIKREDLLHTTVSGNKFRKLKYNLEQATREGYKTLLTFGGPFSNHLAATAAAGMIKGFKTIGVIRGDEKYKNPTLQFCQDQGMTLFPVSRSTYREKHNSYFRKILRQKFGKFYLIPEGGTNSFAVRGCSEILTTADKDFDVICCSVGTGGTLAGLIQSAQSNQKVLGFAALCHRGLEHDIERFTEKKNWEINHNYVFGGYAKLTLPLIEFINHFNKKFKTPLDPIYTGKLLFGIFDLIKQKQWSWGNRILVIHTGGLQGIAGMNQILSKKEWPIIEV